jgi:hypothetical protein
MVADKADMPRSTMQHVLWVLTAPGASLTDVSSGVTGRQTAQRHGTLYQRGEQKGLEQQQTLRVWLTQVLCARPRR